MPAPESLASSIASTPKTSEGDARRKAKGAVRSTTGCYTCRIRKKKCDEKLDKEGRCQTCVRLRLQCLGFGAKRPECMRGKDNEHEMRKRTKTSSAVQGMANGYSGSTPIVNIDSANPSMRSPGSSSAPGTQGGSGDGAHASAVCSYPLSYVRNGLEEDI